MSHGELRVEGGALGRDACDLLEGGGEIGIDGRSEARGLLDRGILGEDEELRARRLTFGDPTRDLLAPLIERCGLVDWVLCGGNLDLGSLRHAESTSSMF